MTHTKGEWELRVRPTHYLICAFDETGEYKAVICDMAVLENPDHEANAKLIAAAPELLEALKKVKQMNSETHRINYVAKTVIDPRYQFVEDAIAKAEGRES